MYVPATPAQAAPALAPVGILSTATAALAAPVHTSLKVRSPQLNVLADSRMTVTGALLETLQRSPV